MTSLTDFAVVSGPGVRSSGSPVSEAAGVMGMAFGPWSKRGNLALPGGLVQSLQADEDHAQDDQHRRHRARADERLLQEHDRDQRRPQYAGLAQRRHDGD